MDPSNNSPSFLKLIEDDDPIFVEIPYDFATLMWGEQPPYSDLRLLMVITYGL
ncbi:hypothetical protein HanXRQr2_Chr14g0636631 [Helianthus annuus]|uniref:Uncharacterized protein n=1 Tax=Helianthus annuus TaxID=4232 RepID=A0A9K3E7X7_HELAN|nr:hypothetical protein HanXRQr2_Chr14g0636631 [Helianthus annuus]KAJ0659429.1 hypothetical protein HanOQP8_Chr14g0526041 [Helianthus annuus]KAJ0839755.1 hypothetical protein HanPSC8_Chr14g0610611 [Helianthus annuus]